MVEVRAELLLISDDGLSSICFRKTPVPISKPRSCSEKWYAPRNNLNVTTSPSGENAEEDWEVSALMYSRGDQSIRDEMSVKGAWYGANKPTSDLNQFHRIDIRTFKMVRLTTATATKVTNAFIALRTSPSRKSARLVSSTSISLPSSKRQSCQYLVAIGGRKCAHSARSEEIKKPGLRQQRAGVAC